MEHITYARALELSNLAAANMALILREFNSAEHEVTDNISSFFNPKPKKLSKRAVDVLKSRLGDLYLQDTVIIPGVVMHANKMLERGLAKSAKISYKLGNSHSWECFNLQVFITEQALKELWAHDGNSKKKVKDLRNDGTGGQKNNLIPEHIFPANELRNALADGISFSNMDTKIVGDALKHLQQLNIVCWVSHHDDKLLDEYADNMPNGSGNIWGRYEKTGITKIYALNRLQLEVFNPAGIDAYRTGFKKTIKNAKKNSKTFEEWVATVTHS